MMAALSDGSCCGCVAFTELIGGLAAVAIANLVGACSRPRGAQVRDHERGRLARGLREVAACHRAP